VEKKKKKKLEKEEKIGKDRDSWTCSIKGGLELLLVCAALRYS
jgi:hypothetical protein